MIQRILHPLTALLLAAAPMLLLASCGQSNATVAGGGIGGTGKGTITAITVPSTAAAASASPLAVSTGSVTLNGSRQFTTTYSTRFLLDGQSVSASQLSAVAQGLVARVDVGTDVSANFTSGTAVNVAGEHTVIGPVTATNPLAVLGQTVVTTSGTAGGITTSSLAVGEILAVSGNTTSGGTIQATRLDLGTANEPWLLVGTASSVTGGSLVIGAQTVLFNGQEPQSCGGGLVAGDDVKVTAAPDGTFTAGSALRTTTSIQCVNAALSVPPEVASGTIPVDLEGFVSSVNGSDFVVSGQTVHTTAQTTFGDGQLANLQVGTRAEVTGTYDVASKVLTASEVDFSEQRVQIVAPLSAVVSSGSISMLGLSLQVTPLSDVDAGLAGNLPAQVEMSGFWDGSQVYVTDLKIDDASPDASNVSVQGPVTHIGTSTLTLMNGLTVDLTNICLGSESEGSTSCTPATQVLGQLKLNQLVSIEQASYSAGGQIVGNGNTVLQTED